MNNTDKLLRALIEASGYEIEKIIDTKETPISKQSGLNRIAVSAMTMVRTDLAIDNSGEYKRGDDECYYRNASMEVDYKVTKKEVESNAYQVILDTQGLEFSCIVKYITNHIDDIEQGVNDFDTLKPMLDYFNRNS